jgi:tetratricopeptide (TPR) repeat protein
VDCFERAIAKDPGYARAYAGLADSYALMASYFIAPSGEVIPKARAAALKALDLDEGLAEAHVSLALVAQNYDWDLQTAEKEFRRAIALDPNYATGHHWYAEHLAFRGHFDESFQEYERARHLDPLSLIIQSDNAVALYFARQYDRAIAQFEAVRAVEPHFARVNLLALAYAEQGRLDEAIADVESSPREEKPDWIWIWQAQAYLYGRAGEQENAQRNLTKLLQYNRRQPLDPLLFVAPYIGVGDKEQAFAWLEKSLAAHSPGVVTLKVEPIYDPLRTDPRFQKLLQRIGLDK